MAIKEFFTKQNLIIFGIGCAVGAAIVLTIGIII